LAGGVAGDAVRGIALLEPLDHTVAAHDRPASGRAGVGGRRVARLRRVDEVVAAAWDALAGRVAGEARAADRIPRCPGRGRRRRRSSYRSPCRSYRSADRTIPTRRRNRRRRGGCVDKRGHVGVEGGSHSSPGSSWRCRRRSACSRRRRSCRSVVAAFGSVDVTVAADRHALARSVAGGRARRIAFLPGPRSTTPFPHRGSTWS
jgi:hypothetical protein